ncbi:hypothetical protein AY599_01965 [Leptolyngbya valderiana BDU 20041]|nr:hypothetical protein AY599_01965 [Leptolyngbya valderiana BDU 20041]
MGGDAVRGVFLVTRAVLFNLVPARWAIPDQRWSKLLRKRGWLCKACRSPTPEMVRDCTAVLLIEKPERPMVCDVRPIIEVIHHKLLDLADFSKWRHGRVPCWVSMPVAAYEREPDWCQRIPFDAFYCTADALVSWSSDLAKGMRVCEECGIDRFGEGGDRGDTLVVPADQADAPMWMTTTGWTLFAEPIAEAISRKLGRGYRREYFDIVSE